MRSLRSPAGGAAQPRSGRTAAPWRAGTAVCILAVVLIFAACGAPEPAGVSVAERAQQSPVAADSASAKVISQSDLPPEGTRSLFDHLLAQNDGLPYPFENLVALIQRQDPQANPPVSLMIPLGRSLLKASADFARPRVLVAADFHAPNNDVSLGLAPRGQLFLGFVENAHEIEVISYNEAAGRYEFQLVQNYCEGCVPRIVYARRAICSTCHQGGTPIFPQRPWSETNGQPQIAAKITEARGSDPYLTLPVVNPLSAPERFDELTDTGAFRVAAQRAWLDACADAACRRQMLKVALKFGLNPGGFVSDDADAQTLRQLQGGTVAIPESDIRNRDPLAEQSGVKGFFRGLFARQSTEPGAKDNEDLEAFDRLPKLAADLDPVAPRPPKKILGVNDLDGVFALAQFFTESDFKQLDTAAGFQWPKLSVMVERLPAEFFQPAPFARVKTLRALLGQRSITAASMYPKCRRRPPPACRRWIWPKTRH